METEKEEERRILDIKEEERRILDIREKMREGAEYSKEIDAKLTERRNQSAADFWSTKGEHGSAIAALDKAGEDYCLAIQEGNTAAAEKAKSVAAQFPIE